MPFTLICSTRGVFWGGGALGHGPPLLGRQDSIISKEKYAKLWHAPPPPPPPPPPPFVLGSRTALFFEWLKFCRSAGKCFSRPFFLEIDRKKNFKTFFLRKTLAFVSLVLGLGLEHSCPWPRIFLCPWPWLWPRALCLRLHLCS